MTIYGVPITEMPWTTWWMLGSALVTLIGFVGWQVDKFLVGATIIAASSETEPKFGWIREKILPGYLANQPFKRAVAGRQHKRWIGRSLFNLMLLGLGTHIGFWIYAAKFMQP